MSELSGPLSLNIKKDEVLCREGDLDHDLYIIHSGKLLVCGTKGSQVTPFAFIGPGEYLGELSFFDRQPRSACVIAVEDTSLIKIPVTELKRHFPKWLVTMAKSITAKLRYTDELINKKGIRRKNVEGMKPLSIEEQRHYYLLISEKEK